MEFLSSSSMPWCGGLRESDVGSVVFPNSSELFRHHCSSLAEGATLPTAWLLAELPPAPHASIAAGASSHRRRQAWPPVGGPGSVTGLTGWEDEEDKAVLQINPERNRRIAVRKL
ncbi:uncharacterized protein LOC111256590 [Setaria italica]|uniref:uncharacterized protein LOC111256590 n=1 Tax=Setaria italica TaxID=4555 RepID=UPI000BE4B20A|nr:uncharacterized protein LOC111256590 [Setaria italica]